MYAISVTNWHDVIVGWNTFVDSMFLCNCNKPHLFVNVTKSITSHTSCQMSQTIDISVI